MRVRTEYKFNLAFAILLFAAAISFAIYAEAQTAGDIDITDPAEEAGSTAGSASEAGDANQTQAQTQSGTRRNGVFDCNEAGFKLSAGTRAAIGGVYVPVNDAAVTLNTGILVYKECVLDTVTRNVAEGASAETVTSFLHNIATGFNGNPRFVTNIGQNNARISDRVFAENVSGTDNSSPFARDVDVALTRTYFQQTRAPETAYSYTLNQSRGQFDSLFSYALNPANNPLGAFIIKQDSINSRIAQEIRYEEQRLDRSRGLRDLTECEQVPTADGGFREMCDTVTPGFLLADLLTYFTQSGFRQLENATEVGQVVSSVFSSLGNRALGDVQGLLGLARSQGSGSPSFLNQVRQDANARVRASALNAAISVLEPSLDTERRYRSARQAAVDYLETARGQLRAAESQCWQLVTDAVDKLAKKDTCAEKATTTNCTSSPVGYTAATSTQFSDSAIASLIAPLSSVVTNQLEAARRALEKLEALVEGVEDTQSVDAQREAIQTLDRMVAQREIHDPFDLKRAEDQLEDIRNTVGSEIEDTIEEWTTGSGWCNVENDDVVEGWLEGWRN